MLTAMEARGAVTPDRLRERLRAEVRALERALATGVPLEPDPRRVLPVGPEEIRRELRFLRQLSRTLDGAEAGPVWTERAGLGSVVLARDEGSGRERFYRLVGGPLHPLDESQVALSSPLGRALLGSRPREEVRAESPLGRRRLRVLTLRTLPRRLGMEG